MARIKLTRSLGAGTTRSIFPVRLLLDRFRKQLVHKVVSLRPVLYPISLLPPLTMLVVQLRGTQNPMLPKRFLNTRPKACVGLSTSSHVQSR